MINIKEKQDCCGCNACVLRCPKHCITMQVDNEGFLYPIVDEDSCIKCGLCEKVCPIINSDTPQQPLKVYAAYNKDEEIRLQSSSGGIFTLLAEEIIKNGGVVFGVKFNNLWMPEFGYAETLDELTPFRGSKYVQAFVGKAYQQAEEFLKIGRLVLFSGTPCQIAALKKYLSRDYENLFTIDLICHGVPSPKVWSMYLQETCSDLMNTNRDDKRNRCLVASERYISNIESISFRSKISGWKQYSFSLRMYSPSCNNGDSVVFNETVDKNIFMGLMLSHLCLRPSCHDCRCKEGRSHSDITIADFWGIEKYNHELDDNKGVSAVLANTVKGQQLFEQTNCRFYEQTFEQITTEVTTFYRSVQAHPHRGKFFSNINRYSLKKLLHKYTRDNNLSSIFKRYLKKMFRFIVKKDFKIIYDEPGQTCNRLWSYLDTIGWAIETNSKVFILFWDKDICHFDKLRNNKYVSFPLYNKTLVKWIGNDKYIKIVRKFFANRFFAPIYKKNRSNKFIEGWKKRADSQYFPNVLETIKEIYSPNRYIIDEVSRKLNKYKEEDYLIVGVHIRRGDYKTWEGGKYFFSHEEYAQHMDSVVNLFRDKKVCFAISTNEKYDSTLFSRFTICELNNTTAIHDLYTLSLCDYIIGPLSTFSRWASFYGEVPLCFISREMQVQQEKDFSIIESFYTFENGNKIINLTDH